MRSSRHRRRLLRAAPAALVLAFAGCASPIVKPEAFDPDVLSRARSRGPLITPDLDGEELLVADSVEWMRLRPGDDLTFVGLRPAAGKIAYCLALECVPERDLLVVLPLNDGETPLTALGDGNRRAALTASLRQYRQDPVGMDQLVSLSLREAIDQKKLGPPIPDPRRVLAVAANFPSHLLHDLATDPPCLAAIAKTPPRIFLKFPPQPPPGTELPSELPFRGVIGPFDDIVHAALTWLPKDEGGTSNSVPTALDYEVELGIVIGKTLGWDDVREADDATLYAAVAGYLLVSDVKARNPQVYERALARKQSPQSWPPRYVTGDPDTDLIIGNWDETTCAWWSYAASLGDFTAVGPYFVASNGEPAMPAHDLLGARTYGAATERGYAIPGGRQADRFYLRQCARATEEPGARDQLLWCIPQILRAALDPTGALAPSKDASALQPGDVIALGTPGGITLTVRHRKLYRLLGFLLFWWDARDWHDAFFGKDVANYLHQGDRLFQWGEGLGCQRMLIRSIAWPPPPGVVPEREK